MRKNSNRAIAAIIGAVTLILAAGPVMAGRYYSDDSYSRGYNTSYSSGSKRKGHHTIHPEYHRGLEHARNYFRGNFRHFER